MNWKDYEKQVHQYFSQLYPHAHITYDAKIIGRYSKKERQIDVLIEDEIAGFPLKIAVDAKYFSKKIDVKCVESFISMIEDVEANQGLLVTQKGYSEAAINRAHYGPHKLELDVLNFDELLNYQGLSALPYSDHNSIILSAPFGWVIDNSKKTGYLACLYQRGLDLVQAQKNMEWIYLNFWHKNKKISSIADLVKMQNDVMTENYSNLSINNQRSPTREDARNTYIRVATWDELPGKEITGYLECDEFIVFFVLFTKEELESRNLRKLAHVLKYSTPVKINFDNTKVIEQLKIRSNLMKDPIEKAHAYRQLADWYMEMGNNDKAMKYRRLCWETFPETYENIVPLIAGELNLSATDAALKYSTEFFALAPDNPRVMQDLLLIYDNPAYTDIFHKVISELKSKYHDNNEALGNISFHYGMYLSNMGDNSAAIEELKLAKKLFSLVDKGHCAIIQLDDVLSKIA